MVVWVYCACMVFVFCGFACSLLKPYRRWLAALVFIALGFLYAWLHASLHINQQLPEKRAGKDLILTGVVSGLPEADSESRRFIFEIEKAEMPADSGSAE
ncbi:MAG: Unknown protein, partial [uncultured Thiotrichaceae bacterium]